MFRNSNTIQYKESRIIFCDGTQQKRESKENEPIQLYIIIAKKGEETRPVFFVLLNSKEGDVYKTMFTLINICTRGRMEEKEYIMWDMEINNFGFLKVFGNIQQKICYFRFGSVCTEN